MIEKYYTLKETATLCCVSPRTFKRWAYKAGYRRPPGMRGVRLKISERQIADILQTFSLQKRYPSLPNPIEAKRA